MNDFSLFFFGYFISFSRLVRLSHRLLTIYIPFWCCLYIEIAFSFVATRQKPDGNFTVEKPELGMSTFQIH